MTQPIFYSANTLGSRSVLFHMKQCSWKTNCVRFGKIALLFAFVLFAGGCVVRIADESFLDYCFQEVSLLLEWRTAVHFVSFRFQYNLINTFVKEGSLPSLTIHLAELSQLDRNSPAAFNGTVYRCPRWKAFQSRWNAALCRQ